MPWNPRPPINGKSPRKREVYITEKFDSTTSTWPRPAFILSRQICLHGAASTTLSLIIPFYVTVPRVSTGHRSYSQMLRPLWTFSANHRHPSTFAPPTGCSHGERSNHVRLNEPSADSASSRTICGTFGKYFIKFLERYSKLVVGFVVTIFMRSIVSDLSIESMILWNW